MLNKKWQNVNNKIYIIQLDDCYPIHDIRRDLLACSLLLLVPGDTLEVKTLQLLGMSSRN